MSGLLLIKVSSAHSQKGIHCYNIPELEHSANPISAQYNIRLAYYIRFFHPCLLKYLQLFAHRNTQDQNTTFDSPM